MRGDEIVGRKGHAPAPSCARRLFMLNIERLQQTIDQPLAF
jgi:hypothetical protein